MIRIRIPRELVDDWIWIAGLIGLAIILDAIIYWVV